MSEPDIAVVSYARTPFDRAHVGKLKNVPAHVLAAHPVRRVLESTGLSESNEVDDVVLGCSFTRDQQRFNMGRVAALHAGLPESVPGMTLNRRCTSGLEAIATAAERIRSGRDAIVVAGGVEKLSILDRDFETMDNLTRQDDTDGDEYYPEFLPPAYFKPGRAGENVARRFEISREQQDAYALESHQKAVEAQKEGYFDAEIAPIEVTLKDPSSDATKTVVVDEDGNPRENLTLDLMAQFPTYYDEEGTVTAGNSPPLTDGAAAVVLMSLEEARARGLDPLGVIREAAVAGVAPDTISAASEQVVSEVLEAGGMEPEDIDLVELAESYASTAIHSIESVEVPSERINVHGGSIAIGHPAAATGARLLGTLLRGLRRRDGTHGVAELSGVGGMGMALLVERR